MGRNRHRRASPGTDTARRVAFDGRAPAAERTEALAELQKAAMPTTSDFLPVQNMQLLVDFMRQQAEEAEFTKALRKPAPYPSAAAQARAPGMQSVRLDDIQLNAMGDFYDKPAIFNFDAMRQMVDQTPILSSVILTRIRQVMRFCRQCMDGKAPGFRIELKDGHEATDDDTTRQSQRLLAGFFSNSGWENKPRLRAKLKRDDFATLMAKLVRDTLVMDSMPIELEWKRDKRLGIDGIYAVDGSTIRLCTEEGYRGDDEVFALQVVQGNIRTLYTSDDLIYVPRNPRTNVLVGGYGLSETELLVRTVTGFLNAFTYNTKFFDSNSLPRGVMNLYGNYSEQDIAAFKRYWNAMVKGVDNRWSMPVLISKDAESAAKFEPISTDVNDVMFAKWMQLLGSIICAIYGMAPEEINMESFSSGPSSLSGSDTEEKIIHSKDKGLRPLLTYFENIFTDYLVAEFDDKYAFRFTGLDQEDATQVFERQKLVMTVNEMRARDNLEPIKEKWGDAPLNPALQSAWQAEAMPEAEDFGDPNNGAQPGKPDGKPGGDFGDDDDGDYGDDSAAPDQVPDTDGDPEEQEQLGKSFGLPIYAPEV